jgi:drug/metabolite transporter (DMT)-like permease
MNERWRGSLLVVVSAASFGLMPIFARFAYGRGVGVEELLFIRFLIAFLAMGLFLYLNGGARPPPPRRLLALLGLGAIGYFAQSTLYFNSLLYIPVSVVALVLYTYPAFVTAGSLALGWEKVSGPVLASLALATTGLTMVAQPALDIVPIGLLLALGASVTYTAYILVSTHVLRGLRGEVASFYVMGGASLSFGLVGSLAGRIRIGWDLEGWIWVSLIAVVATALAATAFLQGLKLVGPSRASILSLVEPLTSIMAAYAVFGERLGVLQWVGGSLILLGATVAALSIRERP